MNKIVILLPMVSILTACVAPQAYFPQLPQQNVNTNSPQSQHDKLSKIKADQFITVGQTNAADISMHYGVPNIAMKGTDGNDIWMYQAKSMVSGVKMDSGTNINASIGGASSASSMQMNNEFSSKSTMLRITFNLAGIVESYDSQTTMN
ncbi:MAG: hypothetical protein COB35_03625 [Gammaproteobacteria bacterium]|nr:MAG: hypothetical protein COB35_03625 [Gammaproteobacteria bacterium]